MLDSQEDVLHSPYVHYHPLHLGLASLLTRRTGEKVLPVPGGYVTTDDRHPHTVDQQSGLKEKGKKGG